MPKITEVHLGAVTFTLTADDVKTIVADYFNEQYRRTDVAAKDVRINVETYVDDRGGSHPQFRNIEVRLP